jgi:hypothetical protein
MNLKQLYGHKTIKLKEGGTDSFIEKGGLSMKKKITTRLSLFILLVFLGVVAHAAVKAKKTNHVVIGLAE